MYNLCFALHLPSVSSSHKLIQFFTSSHFLQHAALSKLRAYFRINCILLRTRKSVHNISFHYFQMRDKFNYTSSIPRADAIKLFCKRGEWPCTLIKFHRCLAVNKIMSWGGGRRDEKRRSARAGIATPSP